MSQPDISGISQSFIVKWEAVLNTGLFLTASAVIGSTRMIEWIKGPVTKEGMLLTSLLNGVATISGSMLAKKYHLDSPYYKGIIAMSSIALGSFATPYITSTLFAKTIARISLPASFTIGAANLIIRLTTYALYNLLEETQKRPHPKNQPPPDLPPKNGPQKPDEVKLKTISSQETKLKDFFSWKTFPQQPGPTEVELFLPKLINALSNLTKEEAKLLGRSESFYRIIEHPKYRSAATSLSAANLKILAEETLYIDGFDAGMKAIIDQLILGTPDLANKVKVLAETGHPGLTDLCLGIKVELIKGSKSIMTTYNRKRVEIEKTRKTKKPEHYNKREYGGKRYRVAGDVPVEKPPVEREPLRVWTEKEITDLIANIQKFGPAYKDDYFRLVETMKETSLTAFAKLLLGIDLLKKFFSLEKQLVVGATSIENRQLRLEIIFKSFSKTQIENSAQISEFWEVLSNFDDRFRNSAIEGFSAEQFTLIIENMTISFEILGFFIDFIQKIKKPDIEKDRAIVRNQVSNINTAYTTSSKTAEIKEKMFNDKNATWSQFQDRNNILKTALTGKVKALRIQGTV